MVNAVILAAGLGTRLGRPHPKPLTRLADGRTILRRQLDQLTAAFGSDLHITVVVGFKLEMILEAAGSEASFVYNEIFDQTNTAKSLLRALRLAPEGGVLWLNGDVVFTHGLLGALRLDGSFVAVNTDHVSDEEIKYTVDGDGYIKDLSKQVAPELALGEAVGINYVCMADRAVLVQHLERCADNDYFERGIETAIGESGLRFSALDISPFGCVEVDFLPDLARANLLTA
jgi:CDP-glycerol glycerophosphotransferase